MRMGTGGLGVVLAALTGLLAGCSSPSPERFANVSRQAIPLPSVPGGASVVAAPEARTVPAEVAQPARPEKPVVAEPVPEAVPEVVPAKPAPAVPPARAVAAPMPEWVDLGPWLEERGWSQPHLVPMGKGREVRIESDGPGGSFEVVAGQKRAWWNRQQVWLGFEPRWEKGRLLVHRLDVEAHCRPLLEGAVPHPLPARSVVVDAGHGGKNAGTRSIAGNRFEKEFTLDWALRLQRILEERGWTVVMTRTNDVDLSLAERVDLAEASGASLFVSLHFNSGFPNREAAGLEVYTTTPQGMASHVVREYVDEPGRAFPNNTHDQENLRWAVAVHRSLLAGTGLADRGVRRARFMDVLRWQNRPAILVEGGYLSNPAEAARIQSAEFRQQLAEAVAAGLTESMPSGE